MKNEKEHLSFHSDVLIKLFLITVIVLGIMLISSCAIHVCPTYDGASRAEFRKVYTSTTKHGAKSGYSIIKRRRN